MAEASPLEQQIEQNFLKCAICIEPFRDPRALPCQHGFCRDCLEKSLKASKNKQSLKCPICKQLVKLPEGVKGLPVHFLVNSLQATVNAEKQVKMPSPDTCCGNCNKPGKKAQVRCMDCKEYLCDVCYASHKTLKTMKNHRIVTMDDILSGKVSLSAEDEDECKEHGQPYRYYCETEKKPVCQDCVILKKCHTEHDRITLEKAAQNQSNELDGLFKKSTNTLQKYQKAVKTTEDVKKELKINSKLARDSLDKIEKDYICQLRKTLKGHQAEIDQIEIKRMKELDEKKASLESTIRKIQKANEDTIIAIKSGSNYEIISSHATLSTRLQELSQSQPVAADRALGYIKFEAVTRVIPSIGKLSTGKEGAPGERWKLVGQFNTGKFNELHGLDINKDGDVLLASWEKGAKVFSRDGEVRCTLFDLPACLDVAVTPDNKYVTIPRGDKGIQINDSQGNQLSTTPVTNVNNVKSKINSVAVDIKGRIIVGQIENTISIHNADGSLVSRFATQRRPYRLAVTSNGEIVSSFYDSENERGKDVQLMDYTGCNVRVIQPPTEVKTWTPGFVCCRQGEIFVSNGGTGDPRGIYRYTSEGDYLDCVTTEVRNPSGIALTQDGMELFVAEYTDDKYVKIFQRP